MIPANDPIMTPSMEEIRAAVDLNSTMDIGHRITVLWNAARLYLQLKEKEK